MVLGVPLFKHIRVSVYKEGALYFNTQLASLNYVYKCHSNIHNRTQNGCSFCFVEAILTLKAPNQNSADDILIFNFNLSKKIRLDFLYKSSA